MKSSTYFLQIGFRKFFKQMFLNTDISRFDGQGDSGNDQIVIVYEPRYFESLNEALVNDTDFAKENLGKWLDIKLCKKNQF